MDDWEDRYLDFPVEKPTELLVYRNWTRTPDQDWCDVRVSHDHIVREWPASERMITPRSGQASETATVPDNAPMSAVCLNKARQHEIDAAITQVNEYAKDKGMKTPKINEVCDPVRKLLEKKGLTATKAIIQNVAGGPQHAAQRGPVGKRNYSLPPFSSRKPKNLD